MIRYALLALAANSAGADPLFRDMSANLPPHQYTGGWEHFVGGGVAVFDCNADTLPDLFAAGGSSPPLLAINRRNFRFDPAPLPELTDTIGAYPIDIDADGWQDLFVLRLNGNRLLRGGPDCMFSDVTDDWQIPQDDAWSTAFTAWWEADGLPTLAVGNYVDRADPDDRAAPDDRTDPDDRTGNGRRQGVLLARRAVGDRQSVLVVDRRVFDRDEHLTLGQRVLGQLDDRTREFFVVLVQQQCSHVGLSISLRPWGRPSGDYCPEVTGFGTDKVLTF